MGRDFLSRTLLLAVVALGIGPYGAAEAAAFNCAQASGCMEKVICATPQLSQLDSRMSSLYFRLQSYANRRGANRLLSSQIAWLSERDTCGCDANCLVTMYESRITLFEEVLGQ